MTIKCKICIENLAPIHVCNWARYSEQKNKEKRNRKRGVLKSMVLGNIPKNIVNADLQKKGLMIRYNKKYCNRAILNSAKIWTINLVPEFFWKQSYLIKKTERVYKNKRFKFVLTPWGLLQLYLDRSCFFCWCTLRASQKC